jgi:Uma2 family endonuclease
MNVELPEFGGEIDYPESDGIPMADNGVQFVWIVVLYGNLAALFRDDEMVFVAGNQNWFPVEGASKLYKAPDVYVVFGRPKGNRTSWMQWLENDTPMTVVFEILSPSNTAFEMVDKLLFYDEYGVEEYYIYDPERNRLFAYRRGQAALAPCRFRGTYTSPRLGIRFDLTGPEMKIFYPDGRPFLTFEELEEARVRAELRVEEIQRRADRQAELMRRVLAQKATPEELQELQQLLAEHPPAG